MRGPFDELTKLQRTKLLDLLGVHTYQFDKNQEILPTIKNENILGIILHGKAQIIHNEYNGNEIMIEELETDSIFGSNISATNSDNCQILAKEDTEVLVIDYDKLISPQNLKHSYFNIFLRNIFDITNIKFKQTNERVNLLEKKQIREKLLEYFEIEYKKTFSKYIYLPFHLKDLADYLAVNRSAMFRELKHLKEEGFIEVKKKRITLLYKEARYMNI